MSEEEQPQPPKRQKAFDLLASVAVFARRNGVALNDPTLVDRFMADIAPRLREALADPTLVHGSRIERLFEATVLSLGRFKLLKTEDVGRVHAAETLRAPDFRIVLDDGEQWLVEVKNVRSRKPFKQELRMSQKYLSSLQSYADAVGTPLKLAIYWSLWRLWSVISPERFRTRSGALRVSMQEAMLASEFVRLGEVMIMTKPPLRLVLGAATDMPRSVSDEGLAKFMIASARIYSRDVELTDPKDRKLAQVFLFHGEWAVEDRLLSWTAIRSLASNSSQSLSSRRTRAGRVSARPAGFSAVSTRTKRSMATRLSSLMASRRQTGLLRLEAGTSRTASCRSFSVTFSLLTV
ncbi:hypothetical protein [Sinorhizobium fredii]|uniref:hypothetical protein n=1 Tax=Rhizobium fredii TaxID=380 RepID=UPI0018EA15A2|nr:hypothetical protein [Sinorhizobium fredii]